MGETCKTTVPFAFAFFAVPKYARLETGVETAALLSEIEHGRNVAQPRARSAMAHAESMHIELRSIQRTPATVGQYYGDIHETMPTAYYDLFPHTTSWLESFAAKKNGTLELAFIAILRPHGKVHTHYDAGTYYRTRERYHLVLQSEGTNVRVEDEEATFAEGELWWFNNRLFHTFSHGSDRERIHIIFDLRSKSPLQRLRSALTWYYMVFIQTLRGAGKDGSLPMRQTNK